MLLCFLVADLTYSLWWEADESLKCSLKHIVEHPVNFQESLGNILFLTIRNNANAVWQAMKMIYYKF